MMGLFGILQALGLSERAAKILGPLLLVGLAIAALLGTYAMIRHGGEKAGEAKVTAKVEKQHAVSVANARHDEQAAQATTARIAERTARADAVTSAYVQSTIEDMHHALDALPPATSAAPLPAAPVDELRDHLNALIARSNGAAEAGTSAGGDDADGQAEAPHR